jgi:hypothetical protein
MSNSRGDVDDTTSLLALTRREGTLVLVLGVYGIRNASIDQEGPKRVDFQHFGEILSAINRHTLLRLTSTLSIRF